MGRSMNDEWDVKRVADLVVGDEVRDYGELMAAKIYFPARRLLFPESTEHWPMEARVDVRRPVTDTASRTSLAA